MSLKSMLQKIPTPLKRKSVLVPLLLCLIATLNYNSFCFRKMRWLSDEELIFQSFLAEAQRGNLEIADAKEETVRAYLKTSLYECSIRRGSFPEPQAPLGVFFCGQRKLLDCTFKMSEKKRTCNI